MLSLLLYQSQAIDAAELDWLQQISLFMDKFYRWGWRGSCCHLVSSCLVQDRDPASGEERVPHIPQPRPH